MGQIDKQRERVPFVVRVVSWFGVAESSGTNNLVRVWSALTSNWSWFGVQNMLLRNGNSEAFLSPSMLRWV